MCEHLALSFFHHRNPALRIHSRLAFLASFSRFHTGDFPPVRPGLKRRRRDQPVGSLSPNQPKICSSCSRMFSITFSPCGQKTTQSGRHRKISGNLTCRILEAIGLVQSNALHIYISTFLNTLLTIAWFDNLFVLFSV